VQSFYILHEGLVGILGESGLQEIDYEDAIDDKLISFKNIKGGWLGIMTKRVRDQEAFKTWHYKNDPTHIGFFSEATFQWLTGRWSSMGIPATLVITGNDVVLIEKG